MVSSEQQMSGVGKWAAIWTDLGPIAHWRSDVETWGGPKGRVRKGQSLGPRRRAVGRSLF